MMPSHVIITILLTLTSSVCGAATDIFLPALPSIVSDLNTDTHTAQLTIPYYLLGSAITAPFFGPLSDSYGRRSMLLFGLSIFLCGTLLCATSYSINMLLIGRVLQGSGSIASSVVGWALIYELYPPGKSARVMSFMSLGISAMPIIAPILGGYLTVTLGWRMIFFLTAFTALGLLISLTFMLKDIHEHAPRHSFSLKLSLKTYRAMLSNRVFVGFTLLFPILLAIEWCWLTVTPFYFINQVGLSPDRFGLGMALAGGGWIAGSLTTSYLLTRLDMMRTMYLGVTIACVGCIIHLVISLMFPLSPAPLLGAFALISFGSTFVYSPSSAKAFQFFDRARGATSAIRSTVVMITASFGGMIGSYLRSSTLIPLSLCILLLALTALCLYRWISRQHERE